MSKIKLIYQNKHRMNKEELMFGNFKEDARSVLMEAKKEKMNLKHPYVGSEHLLLAILKTENEVSLRLKDYHLTYEKFKEEIIRNIGMGSEDNEWFLYTPLLKRILENAILDSKETNGGVVTISSLFASMLEEGEGIAIRILISLDVDLDELYREFRNRFQFGKQGGRKKKLILDELGVDLTKKALEGKLDPVIGRENEIARMIQILCRRCKNNPLLIGEAGVGKTAIVEGLATKIALGEVPISLKTKRIISISMSSFVAGTKYRGEFEEKMSKVLKEVEENPDIILFIDEVHTLVGAGGAEGAIDASNIFKPALARGNLRMIGATTTVEYKKFIEKDAALERRFQKVLVEVPSKEEVVHILSRLKPIYEGYHHVSIPDDILKMIVDLSEEYLYERFEPDKSIDILDEVCSKAYLKETKEMKKIGELKKKYESLEAEKSEAIGKADYKWATKIKEQENQVMNDINLLELNLYKQGLNQVTKEDVVDVLHAKTGIPMYELLRESKKMIEEFSRKLKANVVGQEEGCRELVRLFKKIKLGLTDFKCNSILFVGPTGVGKTMMSTLFARELAHEHVIKLDMSEYADSSSISRIMGANPGYIGYDDHDHILEKIKNHPHSVLILDEVEKAHPKVLNLFYQILEDGKILDASSSVVRFDQVTILMTSNIGFEENQVGFLDSKKEAVTANLMHYFNQAFINRIDSVVICESLKEEHMKQLIQKKLRALKKKYKDKIEIVLDKKVVGEILEMSNYKQFGARKIDKILKDSLEDKIVDSILENESKITLHTLEKKVLS